MSSRARSQWFLLVLSLIGAGIAIYLTLVHYNESVPLVCSGSGLVNCGAVLSSPYAVVPGTSIPISLPGLAWCLVIGALALLGILQGKRPGLLHAELLWTLLGMLTVLYLVYVELVRLHAICAWCTGLHVLIFLMFITAFVQWQARTDDEESVSEEMEEPVREASTPPRS
ncbi:MAG TPA: vitamin K epoxide reductase family protein [Ktedonobacteraceae bacterium]|jgi:uncharacterized membrane protein|nr:vitamin K epoxide reductase family protein [Ktedonobacteraceae bacterium]